MTKLRAPISFEDGITRIAGHLGWAAAAAVIDQKERTLRAYSDPDDPRQIALRDALRLDQAYQRAGGDDAPLLDAFALQLDVAMRESNRCRAELSRRTARLAVEGGQAVSALIVATDPNATDADRALAAREVRENMDAARDVLPLLVGGEAVNADTS